MNTPIESIEAPLTFTIQSGSFNPSLRSRIFHPDFLLAFSDMLETNTKNDAAVSRSEAAFQLGLTPRLEILAEKEEKGLRAKCEVAFTKALESCQIKLTKDDHNFKLADVLENPKVTGAQRQAFRQLVAEQNFDAYENYRAARNDNLSFETLLGMVINQGIVPGYTTAKGPGGGIVREGSVRQSAAKKGTSDAPSTPRVIVPKYPEHFLTCLRHALNGTEDLPALLPVRSDSDKPVFVKRGTVLQRMAALYFNLTKNFGMNGSEFENMISMAVQIKHPDTMDLYEGFHSMRGAGGGLYRLSPNQNKDEIRAAEEAERNKKKGIVTTVASVVAPVAMAPAIVLESEVEEGLEGSALPEDAEIEAEVEGLIDSDLASIEANSVSEDGEMVMDDELPPARPRVIKGKKRNKGGNNPKNVDVPAV